MEKDENYLIDLFCNALSNNNDVRQNAENEIINLFNTNIVFLINFSASIINSDNVPLSAQRYAFTIFTHAFNPTAQMPINTVKQNYHSLSDDIKFNIRSAIIRGLIFPNRDIYQQAAFLIALIIAIDENCIADLLQFLRTILINPDQPESSHYAAVLAYRELHIHNAITIKSNNIGENFINQILTTERNDFVNYIFNGLNFPIDFINEVVITLKELVKFKPDLFLDPNEQNKIYESLEKLLPYVQLLSLYRNIHLLLFQLVESLYGKEELNIARIISITTNGFTCNNEEFVSISIDFWNEILYKEIEFDKLRKIQKAEKSYFLYMNLPYRRQPVINANYSLMFASQFTYSLLKILSQIDPNDHSAPSLFEFEEKKPYMYAQICIKNLFPLKPKEIFNIITSYCAQCSQSNDWTIHYSILQLINCLCCKLRFPGVEDFLKDMTSFIVFCVSSQIEKLCVYALDTLKSVAIYYNFFLLNNNFEEFLKLILVYIQSPNYIIVIHTIDFFLALVQIENSPIDKYFLNIFQILNIQLQKSLNDNNSEYEYFQTITDKIFTIINSVINRCSNQSITYIVDFIGVIKGTLSRSEFLNQNIIFLMKVSLQTIAVIFKRFYFLEELAQEILPLLFNLMNNVNFAEDSLLAITHVITSLNNKFDQYFPQIIKLITVAMNSGSPEIIKNAVICLTNIYKFNAKDVLQYLPPTIDLILNSLHNRSFMPDFYPDVAYNLALILDYVSTECDIPIQFREKAFQIYKDMSVLPLDFTSKNGRDFAASVLECALLGFSKIIKISKDDTEFLINNRNIFYQPVNLFNKYEAFQYPEKCLLSFLELMASTLQYMPQKTCVVYKKRLHTTILIAAMNCSNPNICETAKNVYNTYKDK